MVAIAAGIPMKGHMHVNEKNLETKAIQQLVKQNTGKIPCSLFAKGAMLFFSVIFCAQKTHKVKIHIATVAPEFNHQRPKQKSAKNGEELCTVNIFFKNNTRTKCSS